MSPNVPFPDSVVGTGLGLLVLVNSDYNVAPAEVDAPLLPSVCFLRVLAWARAISCIYGSARGPPLTSPGGKSTSASSGRFPAPRPASFAELEPRSTSYLWTLEQVSASLLHVCP